MSFEGRSYPGRPVRYTNQKPEKKKETIPHWMWRIRNRLLLVATYVLIGAVRGYYAMQDAVAASVHPEDANGVIVGLGYILCIVLWPFIVIFVDIIGGLGNWVLG